MRKTTFLILTAVVFSFFIALGAVKDATAADTIKIGAVLPLAEITGKDASRSMQLAVKQINAAGGLLGRQVELILVDDENKPDKAAAAVDKLVNVDKVDVIVGGVDNATTMEAITALKKYTKITVWTGASSAKVEQALEGQDWFFHLHAWDYELGAYYEKIWREIVQKYPQVKRKKIFAAYKDDPFGSDIFTVASPVARAYLNIMQGEIYNGAAGTTDIKTVLRNARRFDPDIFIWEGPEQDAIPVLEEARNSGLMPPVFLAKTMSWPADFGKQVGAEGIVLYAFWHESLKTRNKACLEYINAFSQEFNETPRTYFGPLGYTNIMIVANAIKGAGTLEKEALIKNLEATSYESPLGDTFTFSRGLGVKYQAKANPKLMQWQGGEVKVIYPWELATARLIYPFPAQGFNKNAPLEVKPPVAPVKPTPAAKPAVPAPPKAPAPKPKPAAAAPAVKPAPKPQPAAVAPAGVPGCIGSGCTEEDRKAAAPAPAKPAPASTAGCIGSGCTEEDKKATAPVNK